MRPLLLSIFVVLCTFLIYSQIVAGSSEFSYFEHYPLISEEIINQTDISWGIIPDTHGGTHAFNPVHATSIQEVNVDGHKYWGYMSDQDGDAIGVWFSEDLKNWTAYTNNPVMGENNRYYRWPSVTYNGSGFEMIYAHWGTDYDIVYATSPDGYNWTDVEIIDDDANNPFLWKDPTDDKWVVLYHVGDATGEGIAYRKASKISDLNTASEVRIITYEAAAPTIMYDSNENKYVLIYEVLIGGTWYNYAATSDTLDGPYTNVSDNPIHTDGACDSQFIYGNYVYNYYSKQREDGTWDERLTIHNYTDSGGDNNISDSLSFGISLPIDYTATPTPPHHDSDIEYFGMSIPISYLADNNSSGFIIQHSDIPYFAIAGLAVFFPILGLLIYKEKRR